jgi:hypothetical protein
MQLQKRQRGLGLWGWLYVLFTLGFIALVSMNLVPLYLAEMSIQRVLKAAAQDSGNANLEPAELRNALKLRWDVEGITTLDVRDVKIERSAKGRALAYDYEAKAPLFGDVYIGVHFQNKYPMSGGGGVE